MKAVFCICIQILPLYSWALILNSPTSGAPHRNKDSCPNQQASPPVLSQKPETKRQCYTKQVSVQQSDGLSLSHPKASEKQKSVRPVAESIIQAEIKRRRGSQHGILLKDKQRGRWVLRLLQEGLRPISSRCPLPASSLLSAFIAVMWKTFFQNMCWPWGTQNSRNRLSLYFFTYATLQKFESMFSKA